MSTVQKLSLALVGTTVVLMSANPANAITLSKGSTTATPNGIFSTVLGATTIDFNNGINDPNGVATYSTPNAIVQGDLPGQYAAPAGDKSSYLTISPADSNVQGNTGPVTINFKKALNYFGLHWGSVDTYNSIAFFNGSTLLRTFTGSDVSTPPTGNQTIPQDNLFVDFFADPGETFDKIVLSSSGVAFETDNHSYRLASVPEPTTTLGLLAFGIISAGSFVKRKSKLV
ncbi:Npun_F0296 family exosortase-dependent surface protein [Nostoc sp.]|uniref:Npun_F0296 family exosortase-dependent surface protein n=1 Tax=Nostoc sp. TaxID=1180 RepID=UPI002FFC4361